MNKARVAEAARGVIQFENLCESMVKVSISRRKSGWTMIVVPKSI